MSELIDLSRIQETSDGDTEFEIELIEMYLEDAEMHLGTIQKGIEDADAPSVKRAAHTLKGSSANIGANAIRSTAYVLEQRGAVGDLEGAEADLAELREVFTGTAGAFREYLAKIR